MKRNIKLIIIVFLTTCSTFAAKAYDIKEALGGLFPGSSSSSIENVIGSVLGTDKVELKDMVGTWNYSAPAVSFKSQDLLKKAGGAAAATAIENKIAPIYKKAGITSLKLTIGNDSTFTMNVKKVNAKGTISKGTDGNYIFHFQALGKVNTGSMTAYISKSATGAMDVTFDATKLINIIETVAKYSNNATIKTASTLLQSYDGVTIGFKLKK